MSEEIKPVMSGEEWQQWVALRPALTQRFAPKPEIGVAVLHLAVPDDSPYKITRADIEAIEAGLNGIECVMHQYCASDAERSITEDEDRALRVLRAKLAALLPPEGTP